MNKAETESSDTRQSPHVVEVTLDKHGVVNVKQCTLKESAIYEIKSQPFFNDVRIKIDLHD